MDKNKDKTEFHIQEYECGQKSNLYRMDSRDDCINISSIKTKSNLSLLSLFRAFFYPENYPLSNYFHI